MNRASITNKSQTYPSSRISATKQKLFSHGLIGLYFLILFEGAIRKWGFPSIHFLLLISKIPIILFIYAVALNKRSIKTGGLKLKALGFMAVTSVFISAQQIATNNYGLNAITVATFGWICYFLYVPLPFVMATHLRTKTYYNILNITILTSVLNMLLMLAQFAAPNSDILNVGSGLDEDSQFTAMASGLGRIRPPGLFTSTIGASTFVSLGVALLISEWMKPKQERLLAPRMLIVGVITLIVSTVVSQSRTLFLSVGIILIFSLFSALMSRRSAQINRGAIVLSISFIAAIIWPILFNDSFLAFSERWNGASESESKVFVGGVFGRALSGFYLFLPYIQNTPLFGYLLGIGVNGVLSNGLIELPDSAHWQNAYGGWAEDPWSRHIVELGPLFGTFFIIIRVLLTAFCARNAFNFAIGKRQASPMILFGFLGPILLIGFFVHQTTVIGFAWFSFGLFLFHLRK